MVTTIDTNFNYLEAIRDTTEVVCEAKVVRHGGRITVLTVEDVYKRQVIGYLSLLHEAPDMPEQQKEKYVKVALNKAEPVSYTHLTANRNDCCNTAEKERM